MNCQEFENLLDKFFDGELSFKQKRELRKHISLCSDCSQLYQEYSKMSDAFHNFEQKSCPDAVITNVFNTLNLEKTTPSKLSVIDHLVHLIKGRNLQFGIVGAVAIIIISLVISYPKFIERKQQAKYTKEDIAEAKDQVKLALAYFDQITNRTQEILENEVLPKQVIKPMKSSIKTAIKPFINGGES